MQGRVTPGQAPTNESSPSFESYASSKLHSPQWDLSMSPDAGLSV